MENPLASLAWSDDDLAPELAVAGYLHARFDQCMYGLVSAKGGLHKKPTMVRTTDAAMQQALSHTCDHSHDHEHVAGAATKASGTYPPKLAEAIAKAVMSNKGGGAQFRLQQEWANLRQRMRTSHH